MDNMIRVDPDKVIERLVQENTTLNRTKIMLEVAYEQLREDLEVTKRELSELRTAPEPSTE